MNKTNHPKNLLIVRTDRIGDVVLSLPLAGIIKKHFPDCRVTFLLRNYTKPLAEHNRDVDEIIILREDGDKIPLLSNVSQIKGKKFDACVVVYPTFVTALIIFLSRIKIRIGTGYRWYSSLFNRKVFVHRKYGEKHELEFNVELLKEIGINENINKRNVKYGLAVDQSEKEKVKWILTENKISVDKPIIIIHPGSGGSAVDLPEEKFKELIDLLNENSTAQIILTGSKSEYDLCERIKSRENTFNFAGKFNLFGLIALINESDIFVSNSTGPIHIAAALNKYTIGFYPNLKACSSKRWGPYSEKAIIFSPDSDCSECKMEQCSSQQCMSTINIKEVSVRITDILKNLNYGEI